MFRAIIIKEKCKIKSKNKFLNLKTTFVESDKITKTNTEISKILNNILFNTILIVTNMDVRPANKPTVKYRVHMQINDIIAQSWILCCCFFLLKKKHLQQEKHVAIQQNDTKIPNIHINLFKETYRYLSRICFSQT